MVLTSVEPSSHCEEGSSHTLAVHLIEKVRRTARGLPGAPGRWQAPAIGWCLLVMKAFLWDEPVLRQRELLGFGASVWERAQ